MGKPWRQTFKDTIEKRTEQGMALRGFRLREGFSQTSFKEALQKHGLYITVSEVSRLETGKKKISAEQAAIFAVVLNADYKYFI